ncbi:MAG: fibro-slime domain-containing protein [Planctomycetes bacterium]|nr:fibro-slime domain-containing protein [Planctomycetota bacterium]
MTTNRTGRAWTAAAIVMGTILPVAAAEAQEARAILRGTVRDFRPDHPDFGIAATGGHFAGNVGLSLAGQTRPTLSQAGFLVSSQWRDERADPIAPHLFNSGAVGVNVVSAPTFDNKSFADTYDPTVGAYGGGNVGSAPAFPTGSLMPTINAPTLGVPFVNSYKRVANRQTTILSTDVFCKDFLVANGHVLYIDGNVTAHVTESFKIQNQARLELLPGATFTLYINKVCTFQDHAFANMNTADYTLFRIFNLGTEPVLIQNQSEIYAHVISPDGLLYVQDGGDFYGAATAQSVFLQNQAGLHIAGVPNVCGVAIADTAGASGVGSSLITSQDTFGQWFRDIPGVNASTRHAITLDRNNSGVYEYLDNAFAPIDGVLYGNGGGAHNTSFTYEISATLTYHACSGQYIWFEGSDDCWVYIGDQLGIDLGGLNAGSGQIIELDRLGLVDGQVYTVRLFYAHRAGTVGRFNLRTNVELVPEPFGLAAVSSPYFD